MNDIGWLAIAFGVVWVALGAYLLSIHIRQKDLERRVAQLDQPDPSYQSGRELS